MNKGSVRDETTHHFLILKMNLHSASERLEFTGYGHIGNCLKKAGTHVKKSEV
jgi:hypothetical protein